MGVAAVVELLALPLAVDPEQLAGGAGGDQQGAVGGERQVPDVGLAGLVPEAGLLAAPLRRHAVDLAAGRGAGVDRAVGVRRDREDLPSGAANSSRISPLAGRPGAPGPRCRCRPPSRPGAGAAENRNGSARAATRSARSASSSRPSGIDADPLERAGQERLLALELEGLDLGGPGAPRPSRRDRQRDAPADRALVPIRVIATLRRAVAPLTVVISTGVGPAGSVSPLPSSAPPSADGSRRRPLAHFDGHRLVGRAVGARRGDQRLAPLHLQVDPHEPVRREGQLFHHHLSTAICSGWALPEAEAFQIERDRARQPGQGRAGHARPSPRKTWSTTSSRLEW